MSKRGSRRSQRGSASMSGGAMGGMLKQVQQMQENMAKTQEALADETLSVTVGGGAVKVMITGHQRLTAIKIDPDAVDPKDVEMLQDLIVAAVNQAIEQSQALASERMGEATGGLGDMVSGLGLPGLGL